MSEGPDYNRLIAVTGKKGAGKDTLAALFIAQGFRQFRFADPLKDMLRAALAHCDLTRDEIEQMIEGRFKETPSPWLQNKTPRFAMQTIGTEWRDMLGKDLWSHMLTYRLLKNDKDAIVTDCRFIHEFEMVRFHGGSVIRIHRDHETTDGGDHISETEMEGLEADIEVFNYGSIDDLAVLLPVIADAL